VTDQAPDLGASFADGPAGTVGGLPRPAVVEDVPEILRLVRELAEYERSLPEVTATARDLTELLFGGNTPNGGPAAFCHVIDADSPGGGLAAIALWFLNASSWLGRHGIYLEDIYVSPEYRGRGYGRSLMTTLAGLCVERGYGRLEWSVLDWNTPAIEFYESLGAVGMDEWTVHRLSGEALRSLADGDPG
jgi:GNAT superfamily N-acetyltransferase